MFKGDAGSKKISSETYDIMVGSHTKIDGDISSDGSIRIEGVVNGSIDSKGNIIVGPEAKITGNITCLSIEISGHVKGNIVAKGNTQIFASGSLLGDIEVISFNIEEGAVFDGSCKISKNQTTTSEKAEK